MFFVQIGAIWRGVALGLVVAGALALILAFLATHVAFNPAMGSAAIWAASGLTMFFTGLVTGRLADATAWLHGGLAALMLSLIGTALAETVHIYNGHGLWLSLGVSVGIGCIGGAVGTSSRY